MRYPVAAACGLALLLVACSESGDPAPEASAPSAKETALAETDALPVGPFKPQDECADLEDFDLFRAKLRRAVLDRNADALIAVADENVKLDFGGGSGTDELRTRLADGDALWSELGEVVGLGCASDGPDNASFPWFFTNLPDGADGFSSLLVTGNDVPVRETAEPDAAVVTTVGWDIVQQIGNSSAVEPKFRNVRTRDGKQGYVAEEKLRSAVDYRLLVNRIDGTWKITAFVAGD